jgi:hypothetical protein
MRCGMIFQSLGWRGLGIYLLSRSLCLREFWIGRVDCVIELIYWEREEGEGMNMRTSTKLFACCFGVRGARRILGCRGLQT